MQRAGVARSGSRSARARVPRNGNSKGKRSQSRSGRTRMTRKGVTCGSHTVSARQILSCASFGRVSQDSSHYACQRASPTVLAVSCNGSPAVLIIEFGFCNFTPKSLTTPPLKPCFLRLERAPVAKIHDIIKKLALSECCTMLHPNANALS